MYDLNPKKVSLLLICVDCNTEDRYVRNSFNEGEEGEAFLNLEAARDHSGPDTFYLANITPIDENAAYEKFEKQIEQAHLKNVQNLKDNPPIIAGFETAKNL